MPPEMFYSRRVAILRSRQASLDWMFRSRETGNVTLVEPPNAALWTYLVASIPRWVAGPNGFIGAALHTVSIAALVYWAFGEVITGVNPFRRLLGGAVLAGQLASLAIAIF
jgi:hypothetical protein